jgi:hypothetical protein
MVVRLARVWDLWQPRRQARDFAEGRLVGVEQAGVLVYYVLMLLAVPGLYAFRRRRDSLLLVLLAPALAVSVAAVLGYGIPRLRHAFEIPLLVLAAAGLVTVRERRGARRATREPRRLAPSEPHMV